MLNKFLEAGGGFVIFLIIVVGILVWASHGGGGLDASDTWRGR
jgi:hypothetical protein